MTQSNNHSGFVLAIVGIFASLAVGCGAESDTPGLGVDVSFASGIPRAARDEAVRIEAYLLDSCDSVTVGERPDESLDSIFLLRDGTAGPAMGIPESGEYGLYAVAQDSNCAIVGAACNTVAIDSESPEPLSIELGSFSGEGCSANQECSIDTGDCTGGSGDCVDLDSDGLGDGSRGNVGCVNATTDSNDEDETVCADTDGDSCDDCTSGAFDPLDDGDDADGDGVCDAGDVCVDDDGDGLGDGTLENAGCVNRTTDSNDGDGVTCADTDGDSCDDCSSGAFDPLDDGPDGDDDGICDAGDVCFDVDGDGLGDGTGGNVGCLATTTDSNDDDGTVCADTDGDGCDDCAITAFDPSNDGTDDDDDGTCAVSDCDDDKPLCASVCTDDDDDGYCIDRDCDDSIPTCSLDCATNSDGDPEVDCYETFCGTDPDSTGSRCRTVGSEAEYGNAIDAANASAGHDYVLLNDFTMTQGAPKLEDDAGVTIRQVAGATLTVDSGGDRLVFEVNSDNNVIDGVRVVNASNARDLVQINGDDNTVQDCVFEGFERRGIFINGGDNAQILHNTVTGGTDSQANEVGAIIVRDSLGSVVAGNTIAGNAMDGLQIRKVTGLMVDHNTIADNGGSGVELYGDDSTGLCLRNNNVTGNANFALNADKVVTFDTSGTCTAPLSAGPAYGNNDFDNGDGSCGGDQCLVCACLPSGSFWEHSVDPQYTSTSTGDQDLYCPAASTLIDTGHDLVSYDQNGDAPGDFNGTAPDIGSRETGPGDCAQ